MDAAEISVLVQSALRGDKIAMSCILDALEQAQKERDATQDGLKFGARMREMRAQRDAAQQDAKDARALAYEECAKVAEGFDFEWNDCAAKITTAIRARIEAHVGEEGMSVSKEAVEAADKIWRAYPKKYTPTLAENMLAAALPHLLAAKNAEIAALLNVVKRIGSRAHTGDGSRTFDQCIADLGWIDDECRAALETSGGVK